MSRGHTWHIPTLLSCSHSHCVMCHVSQVARREDHVSPMWQLAATDWEMQILTVMLSPNCMATELPLHQASGSKVDRNTTESSSWFLVYGFWNPVTVHFSSNQKRTHADDWTNESWEPGSCNQWGAAWQVGCVQRVTVVCSGGSAAGSRKVTG